MGYSLRNVLQQPAKAEPFAPSAGDSCLNGPQLLENLTRDSQGLAASGEMAALIHSRNWAETPIGAPDSWSVSLRMMVNFLLANRFPLLLWWGPQYLQIYNDAYRPIPGVKHPRSLGQPAAECWSEIWNILQPLIDTPFDGGPATWIEDLELEVCRSNFTEETHFTVAYSPVPDDTAPRGIGGVLATVHEITEKIVSARRVTLLRDLGARAMEAKTAEEACVAAANVLSQNSKDLPFALLYLIDSDRKTARLAGAAGVQAGSPISPLVVDLEERSGLHAPWATASCTEQPVIIHDLGGRFAELPRGPWSDPPNTAVVLPVRSNKSHTPAGLLVAGVSSRLALDHLYQSFLELVASQIATAVANARAYEEECKRVEALAEIDRAKTAFFSNVSHEFRTPLTLMLGPVEDLLAGSHDGLSSAVKRQLELVNRNGSRLLRLVNSLLDFSRIEAGRADAVYQPTDISAFTLELASVFRSATEKAGLRLELDCPHLAEPVFVDRDMWEKIVLNLISNAFKFTFDGEIAVSLRAVENVVELRVRDTGVGIPANELPRLFDRFHRVQLTRSRTHEGSGIGLALVQELVKLHGGSLRAESTLGEGSAFIVSIPRGSAHLPPDKIGGSHSLPSTAVGATPFVEEALRWLPDAELAASAIALPLGAELPPLPCPPVLRNNSSADPRPRVLIADDNADMREYLVRLLAEHYEVESVSNGLAALDAVRRQPPHLILTDVMMPQLDGFGLLRELRDDAATRSIPVIVLSARAGEESRVEGLAHGADDYLIKPFSARELLARVRTHLELARIRRQGEDALRQRTAQFETLLNAAPLGVYVVDADFRIRQVNPTASAVFGNIPQLIGRDFGAVMHILWPDDVADEVVQRFRHTLDTGEPFLASERTAERRDRGGREFYEWQINRIPLPDGRHGVVCYFRDISAQVRARIAIAESREEYRALADNLEAQVQARTAEMSQQSELLRALSQRLMQTQDEERRRIARELHDSAGQVLAALAMNLSAIARHAQSSGPRLTGLADDGAQLVQQLDREIRTMSYLLYPPMLDESGLPAALRVYAQGLRQRSGLDISLRIPANFGRFPREIELAMFRIIQECLTNVHRHSGSSKAVISIARLGDVVSLEVEDYGKGMSPDKLREIQSQGSGVGIRGMRERVRQFNGHLEVVASGSGTKVSAKFPAAQASSSQHFDIQSSQAAG